MLEIRMMPIKDVCDSYASCQVTSYLQRQRQCLLQLLGRHCLGLWVTHDDLSQVVCQRHCCMHAIEYGGLQGKQVKDALQTRHGGGCMCTVVACRT